MDKYLFDVTLNSFWQGKPVLQAKVKDIQVDNNDKEAAFTVALDKALNRISGVESYSQVVIDMVRVGDASR
jgi:hypothetical protein